MTYVEVAVSDGPGTLVKHVVLMEPDMFCAASGIGFVFNSLDPSVDGALTTLTESECHDFIAMHGGPIAT